MSVSEVNNQSTGIMIPAIATAAGATAGATVMAPAKYKSFEQLVNAAKDEVNFTEATKDLKEEAKKSAETVGEALTAAQEKIAKLNQEGLFKEGTAAVEDVLKALGAPTAKDLGTIKAKGEVADVIKNAKSVGEGIEITAEQAKNFEGKLPSGFTLATTGEGDNVVTKIVNADVKKAEEALAAAEKAVTDAAGNVTEAQKTAVETAKKDLAAKMKSVDDAITARNANVGYQAIVDGATDGKVSQDVAKKALVTVDDNLKAAFDSIKKSLGKNRIMGGILWGAGALAAGLGIKALVDNKKNA